jgi:hypothetical protein
VVVRVDQAGDQHVAAQINHPVGAGRQLSSSADGLDNAVAGEQRAVGDFPGLPRVIVIEACEDLGVTQK